jgi:hypothetical protein
MHQYDLNDAAFVEKQGYKPKGFVPCPLSADGHINPQVSRFWLGGNRYVSVFHVKPVYYETRDNHWRPLSEVCGHYGNKRITIKYEKLDLIHPNFLSWLIKRQAVLNGVLEVTSPFEFGKRFQLTDQIGIVGAATISFTTTTVYPDPNTETTTFDGGIGNIFNASGTSLSAAESTTTTTNLNDTAVYLQENDYGIGIGYVRAPSGQHYPFRSATLFDTSAIGSDTIDSATLSLATGLSSVDGMNDAYGYISVGSVTPASNTGWSAADITFSNWGTTQYATGIDISSWAAVNNYNNFTLNATGEAAINGSGVSKFGFMHGREFENQNWTGGSANSYVRPFSADNTGTTYDPKLVVEHTAGAGATFRPRIMVY